MRDRSRPPADPRRRSITFRSSTVAAAGDRIVVPDPGSEADPTIHGAVLTVYNAGGLTTDSVSVPLPARSLVPGDGWARRGSGYMYRSSDKQGPIALATVTADRITIRGGKAKWPYTLNEPAQGMVGVRLQLGQGVTWCAAVPASAPSKDHVDAFVGQPHAPAPATCPPLPAP